MLNSLERFSSQFDLSQAELLDVAESRVYRVNGTVLKIYDTEISRGAITLSTIKQYKDLTSQAAAKLAKRVDTWKVSGRNIPICWNVIKIDHLGELPETKVPWTMSRFVPGFNLRDVYYPQWSRRRPVLAPTILEGQPEQMSSLVCRVSLEVNASLGTHLIQIHFTNVIAEPSCHGLRLNVTDVCAIVSEIDGGGKKLPAMFFD